MKILYITSAPLEYSSSANMRNIALINGFIKKGHEVSTLSASIEENSKYIDDTLVNINFKNRYWLDNSKLHTKLTSKNTDEDNWKSKIKNIIIKFVYSMYSKFRIYDSRKSLVKKIDKNLVDETFDLIVSSSDPKSSHLIAKKLVEENPSITKKWIQYWGDPFSKDINKKTWIPNILIQREERKLIKACDYVLYVSPFTLEEQKNIYKKYAQKMMFLPIPYNNEINYPETNNEQPVLGYYGDYKSNDRNILPLYNAVQKMNIILKIYGYSDIKLEEKNNILIKERQKISIIRQEEEKTDLLICVCNKNGTQIPGKIYHYAATNKPILIILDGENSKKLREYFNKFERYIICENNEEDIMKAINNFINQKQIQYLPCKAFNPETIAEEFIKFVED